MVTVSVNLNVEQIRAFVNAIRSKFRAGRRNSRLRV